MLIAEDNSIVEANSAAETYFKTSASMLRRTSVEHLVPFDSPLIDLLAQVRGRDAAVTEYRVVSARRVSAASASSTSTPRPAEGRRSS